MRIPILIEYVPEIQSFRARSGEPLAFAAEAPTRDEAYQKLQEMIRARLNSGIEFLGLEVPEQENPILRGMNTIKDDELFAEWQKAIADYRREVDEGPNAY